MLDPNMITDFNMAATKSLLVPTTSSTVSPIPTVVPNKPHYELAHHSGKTTFWVVFVVMLLSTLAFIGMAWRVPVQKRLFHVITVFIAIVSTLSYFALATGEGSNFTHIVIHTVNKHTPDVYEHVFREIFWARYVEWAITTPLILLDLSFLAGLNGASIIIAIFADLVMISSSLFATYGHSYAQKWGWFALASIAYLVIVYQLAIGGRAAVKSKDSRTAKFFASFGLFIFVLWTIYPVIWALGDGSRILSVDSEIIAYAVLDILSKSVFGFWLLITYARSSNTSIGGFWSHGLTSEGALRLDDDESH